MEALHDAVPLQVENQTVRKRPVYKGHEFETLKLRYEDQVALLRSATDIDLKILTGYFTIQMAFGGWFSKNPVSGLFLKIGLLTIDLALCGIAAILLYNSYRRRKEIVGTIKNLNEAFGLTKKDVYLPDKAINDETKFRPWWCWYLVGIIVGAVGIGLVLFAA